MTARVSTRDLLLPAAVFLTGFVYFYLFRRLGWFLEDEGVLYYPYLRVFHGQLPYRDFFTGYPPMVYYVNAAAFALFGVSINAIRVLMAVVNSLTALGLYLVARRVTGRWWALAPAAFFLVMHPADAAFLVFHNSPYPSWYSVTFAVLGTWTLLRALEADGARSRSGWLIVTGAFAGLTFLSKQNTGVFFLWGVSGFLASQPLASAVEPTPEARWQRALRLAYLALIPLAALLLVRNYLGPLVLALFVLPLAGLALIGSRGGFRAAEWRRLLLQMLLVGLGVVVTLAPWLIYFGAKMGLGAFLRALFLVGADVDRNLYVPFPLPKIGTALMLAPMLLWGWLFWRGGWGSERTPDRLRRQLRWLVGIAALAILAAIAWEHAVVERLLRFEYNLWQIYGTASGTADNMVANGSILVLLGAVLVAWRQRRGGSAEGDPPPVPFLAVLWMAASTFLVYYPRMDCAHLVSAAPLLYVVATGLLGRLQASVVLAVGERRERVTRLAFHGFGALLVLFVVGLKSGPRVYSRVRLVRTADGVELGKTPQVRVLDDRADLYLPIYLERNRFFTAAFGEMLDYVEKTTAPGEPIFAYPALCMVYFLSHHDNPTPQDYFFGNNVGFDEQLDVLRALEAAHVRTVVVANDPTNYFVAKDRAFTRVIDAYLHRRYYVERRIGPYDVLRRYEDGAAASRPGS